MSGSVLGAGQSGTVLRLRGLPLRRLGHALRAIFRGGESADGILAPNAALLQRARAATNGTGNIVRRGPRRRAAGGPGALLWMDGPRRCFGMATQTAGGLSLRCATAGGRRRKWLGGPFCYIEAGAGSGRWLGRDVRGRSGAERVGLLGVAQWRRPPASQTTALRGLFPIPSLKRSASP